MGFKQLEDNRKRKLKVLRLSLKQNCNFSCIYCKPENYSLDVLNIEQFKKLILVSCRLGVNSLRITGGEPLLSSQLDELLYEIKSQRLEESNPVANLQDISLTTNGYLLSKKKANELFKNGLDRITVSLDAIDPDIFSKMIGEENKIIGKEKLFTVLEGIDHAINAGFNPKAGKLKINAVIKKEINENQIFELVQESEIEYSYIERDNEFIDLYGIKLANEKVLEDSISSIFQDGDIVYVDHFKISKFNAISLIRGEDNCRPIALASIIAKVLRDNFMIEISNKYSRYAFDKNKGYGTKEHRLAIQKYGLSDIHRKSFNLMPK